jgi:hypothetical protein
MIGSGANAQTVQELRSQWLAVTLTELQQFIQAGLVLLH